MGESQDNHMKQKETVDSAEVSSIDEDVGEIKEKENDDKLSDTVGSTQMSSTVTEVGEIKETDKNQIDIVASTQMGSTDVWMGENKKNDEEQIVAVGTVQMSSTDGDMEEITEKDIDDTKKYIMSFPSKTKLVRIDDACLRRIDFEECLFPDDGWLDGDLQGLQQQLELAAQMSDLKLGDKWQDLEVTTWKWVDCIQEQLQTDSSSCGLFLLKFMEEWTGQELAHPVTQIGLKLFRKQLPYILLNSDLNSLKGSPQLPQPDKKGDPSDVLMWEANGPPPTELSQGSQTLVADYSVDPKQRLLFDDKREIMASMCDHWPGMFFPVSECNSMEPSKQSTERTPFKDLSNTISTSNGGEPTDAKERIKQQRRQRYAEMDKDKKEELLKKRRESYQQKKAKLQITPSVTATQESHGCPSALSQLQNTPALKGDTDWNKENVVPVEKDAYQMKTPHMSSQGQGSLVTATTFNNENEVPSVNKENEVPSEDDEWLRRNDNYQRQSIPMPFQGQEIIPTVDMGNCSSNEPTSSRIQPQPVIDSTEKKRERERKRYAEMDTNSKSELLARRHVAYQQKKLLADHVEKKRARDRVRYADMSPKKKRSKQALKDLKRSSLNKESIAMENPCWTPEPVHTPEPQVSIPTCDWHIPDFDGTPIYIQPTSEQMSGEVTPNVDVSNKSRRKHVTPGERHALLGLRNEAFYANSKKHAVSSADENPSMSMEGVNGFETPTQSTVLNNETTLPTPDIVQQLQTQSPGNDEGEDEGVILEEDSEDEEGYMFAGQEDDADEDVETDEVNDDSASVPNVPDPYDMI
ncbi:hypothetical protein ACQ4PT_011540 [Festuca glaucescens]